MEEQIRIKQFKGYGLGSRLHAPRPIVAVEGMPLQGGAPAVVKFINVESMPGGRAMAEAALDTAGILLKDFVGKGDIWPLRDAGLQGRWMHIIEDRTEMLSLREALDLHGPIDALSCVERADSLARILDELHERGVLCGFLNPDNVILHDDGTFVLGDFISQSFAFVYNRNAGQRIASVESMAPELIRGQASDARADVFALAALIYRAVTGRSPFPENQDSAGPWHVRGFPVDVNLFGMGCNSHFAQVLRWALAPDPDRRPPSPRRLIMDLRAAVLDHDPESVPAAPPHRLTPAIASPIDDIEAQAAAQAAPEWMAPELGGAPAPRARRVPWTPLAALALLACAGAAFAWWWFMLRTPAAAPPAVTKCPQDMLLVPGGKISLGEDDLPNGVHPLHQESVAAFCVDRYEYPNKAEQPVDTGVSWAAADRACRKQGRRLCTEQEWEAACRGPQGRLFPYGNDYSQNICNTQGRGKAQAGWLPGCAAASGALDMSGNAMEWTADRFGGDDGPYALRGGSWKSAGQARCAARFSPDSVDSSEIGFRCCVDFKP